MSEDSGLPLDARDDSPEVRTTPSVESRDPKVHVDSAARGSAVTRLWQKPDAESSKSFDEENQSRLK